MKWFVRFRDERGDTIVEVLIAIAVISLVLGGAYVTTNSSLQATRAAEERSNAIKLVESQIEQIKALSNTDPDSLFGTGVPSSFCIASDQTVVSSSDEACQVNTAGEPTDAEPIFNLSLTRSGNTFTVTNNWEDSSGDFTDEVKMYYRVYE